MDGNKLVKFVIIPAVLFLAFPFIWKMLPERMSFERAIRGFTKAGLSPIDIRVSEKPDMDAIAAVSFTINGANVSIHQYGSEGKIAIQMEYQRKDPGQAMVESMHLAEAMGAAVHKENPSRAVRRGMFMLTVQGVDRDVVNQIAAVFENM